MLPRAQRHASIAQWTLHRVAHCLTEAMSLATLT